MVVVLPFSVWINAVCMTAVELLLSQVIFGYGVGGEYPIASASASERAEAEKQLQFKRGETVILVFAMQVLPIHVTCQKRTIVYCGLGFSGHICLLPAWQQIVILLVVFALCLCQTMLLHSCVQHGNVSHSAACVHCTRQKHHNLTG